MPRPDDPDQQQTLAAALAQHEAGRLELAEAGYRAVLRHDPDDPDALNLLGVIMQERGDPWQAIALLTHALAADPDFPEALSNLSRAKLMTGAPQAAADLARRAIALDPDLAEAHLNLGRSLIGLDDDAGAASALRQAATLAPDSSDILALLGYALIRLNDTAAVVETLTALLALDPGRIDAMINLGTSLASRDRLDQALMWHEKAAVLDPENPDTHTAVAVTARRVRDLDRSTAAARRTLALAPDRTEMWLALGANLTAMGRFAEAEDCCRKALALNPDSAEARRGLTAIGRHDGDAAEISRLHATLDNAAEPLRERISAGMAMGTLLDRSGDYDTAFTAFDAANRLIRTVWNDAGMAFDGPGLRRYVDWAISTFTRQQFTATAGWGDPSELPVFIVGMPRSGTSLVEQIAASHSEVFGTGESKDVSNIVRTLNGGDMHRPPAAWDREAVRGAATAHLDWMREQGGDAVRVIDKMPDNCRILGQITVLFPRARVIVCRRDPRDVCLSCHFQQFAEGQAWSTDQTELAVRFREIDWLLAHWRAVVPLRILEVRYEDLVANLEAQSRRLIAFLGLDWEPACLAFHETERPVFTASLWQVRQPLYSSSVGRWRNYRKHLGPLLDGLKGLVPDDD